MSKFYCNYCEEEVSLQNGKCPKCGTDWNKKIAEIANDVEKEKINSGVKGERNKKEQYDLKKSNSNDDINYEDIDFNIHSLLRCGKNLKIIMLIGSIIFFIIFFVTLEEDNGISYYFLIPAILLIIYAIIIERIFEWKAYMLYTNLKIMKK